jgi:hypothetical protein
VAEVVVRARAGQHGFTPKGVPRQQYKPDRIWLLIVDGTHPHTPAATFAATWLYQNGRWKRAS